MDSDGTLPGVLAGCHSACGEPLIPMQLTQRPYGAWEFEVHDPIGYVLVFGGKAYPALAGGARGLAPAMPQPFHSVRVGGVEERGLSPVSSCLCAAAQAEVNLAPPREHGGKVPGRSSLVQFDG